MRGRFLILAVALALGAAGQTRPQDDIILRAMLDEIERSKALRVVGLDDRPYYIEYSFEDVDVFNVAATFGGLVGSGRNRLRVPQVQVRAGNYDFDNTNHIFSTNYSGARYDTEWPVEDNYAAIRHNLWLATDRTYKGALEAIARKRASLRNAANADQTPDFARAQPATLLLAPNRSTIDEARWRQRTVDLSAMFNAYPEIFASGVDSNLYLGTSYFVNSEGSVQRVPDNLIQVRIQASAQAPDGSGIHDSTVIAAGSLEALPSELDLRRETAAVANNVRDLLKAPVAENYTGPVLFEPAAAAQLLAQVLGENLRLYRRPVVDPGRNAPVAQSELDGRAGSRILPEWMNVADDATQREWRGQPLLGTYHFDMEGIAPAPVSVVEKGVLRNFLLTRQPVGTYTASNGRARLQGPFGARSASISNLFINATETKPISELKRQLIDLCKQRNKPFGMLVRKLDFPSSAPVNELQSIMASLRGSSSRPVSPPVLIYRVYPDGREELVRGLRFRSVNARSLKDILAASQESAAFHFINNGLPFAYTGFAGFVAPASVISPGLLFDEIEFEHPQEDNQRPPIVPPPPIESRAASNR